MTTRLQPSICACRYTADCRGNEIATWEQLTAGTNFHS